MGTLCKTSDSLYTVLFLNVIEQTQFLNTVFLYSEVKLEYIYSRVNYSGKNVCGNFFWQELIFVDRLKNGKNRKN